MKNPKSIVLSIAGGAIVLALMGQSDARASLIFTPGNNLASTYGVDYSLSQAAGSSPTTPYGTPAVANGSIGTSAFSASGLSLYSYDPATDTLHYRFNSSTTASVAAGGVAFAQSGAASSFSFTVDKPSYYYCTVALNQVQILSPDAILHADRPLLYNYAMFGTISGSAGFFNGPSLQFKSVPSTYMKSRSDKVENFFGGIPAVTSTFYFSNYSQVDRGSMTSDITADIILSPLAPGTSQVSPILPDSGSNQTYTYTAAHSGQWFDPPASPRFDYQMNGTSKFTHIDALPTGFTGPFAIYSGDTLIGNYNAGDTVDFTTFQPGGVSEFSVSGISPFDATTLGFPIQLSFDTPTASFTQTAVPEPAISFILVLAACTVHRPRHRSQSWTHKADLPHR